MSFQSVVKSLKERGIKEYSQHRCACGGLLITRCKVSKLTQCKDDGSKCGLRYVGRFFYKQCCRCSKRTVDLKIILMNAKETEHRQRAKTNERHRELLECT